MAYNKTNWTNETPINPDNLNKLEQGVEDAAKTGGVEVGTIVRIPKTEPTPEGYVDVTDENVPVKLTNISEILTANEGFAILTPSIFRQGNRYYGNIVVQNTTGKFAKGTYYKVLKINQRNINVANTTCGLGIAQWQIQDVGYCYQNMSELEIADLNTSNNSFAKIDIDLVIDKASDTKPIKKVAVTELDPITGSIVDGTNIDDKEHNTYSANTIDGLVVKGEICTVNGTTDSTGVIYINVKNKYSSSSSVFVLSNISSTLSTPYRVTVNYYGSTDNVVTLRFRNASDNSAVTNTAINTTVLICGI